MKLFFNETANNIYKKNCKQFVYCFISADTLPQKSTRQHWIQGITFAVETNAADTHTHTQPERRRVTQYLLRSLSDGEGKKVLDVVHRRAALRGSSVA